MYEMPEVMIPSDLSPAITRFSGQVSFHAWISDNFCRSRRPAGRAYAGIITRPRKSRSKFGVRGGGFAARGRTMVRLWQTRVVRRSRTGIFQRSEIFTAWRVRSYASCESDGSSIG